MCTKPKLLASGLLPSDANSLTASEPIGRRILLTTGEDGTLRYGVERLVAVFDSAARLTSTGNIADDWWYSLENLPQLFFRLEASHFTNSEILLQLECPNSPRKGTHTVLCACEIDHQRKSISARTLVHLPEKCWPVLQRCVGEPYLYSIRAKYYLDAYEFTVYRTPANLGLCEDGQIEAATCSLAATPFKFRDAHACACDGKLFVLMIERGPARLPCLPSTRTIRVAQLIDSPFSASDFEEQPLLADPDFGFPTSDEQLSNGSKRDSFTLTSHNHSFILVTLNCTERRCCVWRLDLPAAQWRRLLAYKLSEADFDWSRTGQLADVCEDLNQDRSLVLQVTTTGRALLNMVGQLYQFWIGIPQLTLLSRLAAEKVLVRARKGHSDNNESAKEMHSLSAMLKRGFLNE